MKRTRFSTAVMLAVLLVSTVAVGVSPAVGASDGDDAGDDRSTATPVTPGETTTGAITGDDADWYAFEAEKGDRLYAEVNILSEEYDELRLSFYGPDGEEIGESAGTNTVNRDEPSLWGGDIAPSTGTYYVVIDPRGHDGQPAIEYDLTVERTALDRDAPGDYPSTAVSLDGNTTVSGTMSGQDVDTYEVELEAGETIETSIESDDSTLTNVQLVSSSASTSLDNRMSYRHDVSAAPEQNDGFSFTVPESGTYYLRVYPTDISQEHLQRSTSYDLSVTVSDDTSKIPDDPAGDSMESAMAIEANGTQSGALFRDDADWYAFDASAGQTIGMSLTATTYNYEDIEFSIYDPAGNEIGEWPNDAMHPAYFTDRSTTGNWTGGGDTAEQTGTYYVKVTGVGTVSTTAYDLRIETERLDDHEPNEQPGTAPTIEANSSVSGVMAGTDVDTFAIELDEGDRINGTLDHDYDFDIHTQLVSPDTPDTTYADAAWEYDVSEWTVDGFEGTVNESGTYYIRVYPVENTIGSFFEALQYNLSVTVSPNESDSRETPTATPENEDEPSADETDTPQPASTPTDEQEQTDTTTDESTPTSTDTESDESTHSDSDETGSNGSDDSSMHPPC